MGHDTDGLAENPIQQGDHNRDIFGHGTIEISGELVGQIRVGTSAIVTGTGPFLRC